MTTIVRFEGNYSITVPTPQDQELVQYLRGRLYEYRRVDDRILYTQAAERGVLNKLQRLPAPRGEMVPLSTLYDVRDVINAMLVADRDEYLARKGAQPVTVRPLFPRTIAAPAPPVAIMPIGNAEPTILEDGYAIVIPAPRDEELIQYLNGKIREYRNINENVLEAQANERGISTTTLTRGRRGDDRFMRGVIHKLLHADRDVYLARRGTQPVTVRPPSPRAVPILPTIIHPTVVIPAPTIPRSTMVVPAPTIPRPTVPIPITTVPRPASPRAATVIVAPPTIVRPTLPALRPTIIVPRPTVIIPTVPRVPSPPWATVIFQPTVIRVPSPPRATTIVVPRVPLPPQATTVIVPTIPRATVIIPTAGVPQPSVTVPPIPTVRIPTTIVPRPASPRATAVVQLPQVTIVPRPASPRATVVVQRPASPRATTVVQPRQHRIVPVGPRITDPIPTPQLVELPALDHPEDQNNPALLSYLESRAVKYYGDFPETVYAEITRRNLTFPTPRYLNPVVNTLLEDDRRQYLRQAQM